MSLTTGNNAIDSLVYSSWTGIAGQAVELTYSFLTRVPAGASRDDALGFQPMTVVQQQAVRDTLALWATVANVTFREVSSSANIRFATNEQGSSSSAYAYLPEEGTTQVELYLNNQGSYNSNFTPGTFGPSVLIHEIGHTLGLKHPGDYNSTGESVAGPFLPASTDNLDYTQMSYRQSVTNRSKYPTTPMLYDIQAIQYLYGANMAYHTGDDVYRFTSSQASQCIWDAGGFNTFDFSGVTGYSSIDLHAGAFSSTRQSLGNVSIAYNVTIRGVMTGEGGSQVTLNDAGDTVTGGNGADIVYVGGGDDNINGGGGVDTAVFSGVAANYKLLRSGESIIVIGQGRDVLTGVETLRFNDKNIAATDIPAQTAGGTSGNDIFVAQTGSEVFDGGSGLDTVVFSGSRAAYTVAPGATVLVTDGVGGTDTLAGIERLVFADGALAFDTAGTAGQAYRLYRAALDRAPDLGGLGFWINALDRGVEILDVARGFIASPEFNSRYGTLDNSGFLTQLYTNVLHRAPDTGGMAFYLGHLNAGLERAEVLASLAASVENQEAVATLIANGISYTPWMG